MKLGIVLARSFEDYKSNPILVLPRLMEILADIVIIIFLALLWKSFYGYLSTTSFTGLSFKLIAPAFVTLSVAGLLILLVMATFRATLVVMALQVFGGERASVSRALEGVRINASKVFLYFVFILTAMGFLGAGFFIAVTLFPPSVFLFMLLVPAGFFLLYFFTFLTPQEIVVRECGVMEGIKASIDFVVSNYREVLGYGGFVILVSLGAWILSFLFFFIINEVTRYHPLLNLAAGIFHNLLSLALGIVISPYMEMVKTYMVVGETYGRTGENKKEEIKGDAREG
jgi:hypothetical protein